MRERKVLLGATGSGTLVFAEFEIRARNGKAREFSASFNEVRPFIASDDYLEDMAESYVDGMDKETRYDMCERLNCTPQNLAEEWKAHSSVEELMDISLFPESFRIEQISEDDIYFQSEGCGQHDSRSDFRQSGSVVIDVKFFDKLHELWDEYHLKEIPEDVAAEFQAMADKYVAKVNRWQDSWIKAWLCRLHDNGDL